MIDKEKMNDITAWLVENVFRNTTICYEEKEHLFIDIGEKNKVEYDYLDVIATLHNLLYEAVNGYRYDYMFHWTNKAGYNGLEDDIFDRLFIYKGDKE